VVVDFGLGVSELVVGGADAHARLDEQTDDVGEKWLVVSLRQPVAVQFPPVFVVFEARPQLVDEGCEIVDEGG
jgi:hypothetical protein